MGPVFYDTRSIAAGASVDVIDAAAWIYRRLPWPATVAIAFDATAVAMVVSVVLGSDMQLGPEFPVDAGGTAGVFPNQDQSFQTLLGAGGDLLKVLYRNTSGGAITANTVIKLTAL